MIDPEGIPVIAADWEAVEAHGRALVRLATAVKDTGADVHGAWQRLAPHYRAPEELLLLAAMVPVRDGADDLADDLAGFGRALVDYAAEVRLIQERLDRLRGDAARFVDAAQRDAEMGIAWQHSAARGTSRRGWSPG